MLAGWGWGRGGAGKKRVEEPGRESRASRMTRPKCFFPPGLRAALARGLCSGGTDTSSGACCPLRLPLLPRPAAQSSKVGAAPETETDRPPAHLPEQGGLGNSTCRGRYERTCVLRNSQGPARQGGARLHVGAHIGPPGSDIFTAPGGLGGLECCNQSPYPDSAWNAHLQPIWPEPDLPKLCGMEACFLPPHGLCTCHLQAPPVFKMLLKVTFSGWPSVPSAPFSPQYCQTTTCGIVCLGLCPFPAHPAPASTLPPSQGVSGVYHVAQPRATSNKPWWTRTAGAGWEWVNSKACHAPHAGIPDPASVPQARHSGREAPQGPGWLWNWLLSLTMPLHMARLFLKAQCVSWPLIHVSPCGLRTTRVGESPSWVPVLAGNRSQEQPGDSGPGQGVGPQLLGHGLCPLSGWPPGPSAAGSSPSPRIVDFGRASEAQLLPVTLSSSAETQVLCPGSGTLSLSQRL